MERKSALKNKCIIIHHKIWRWLYFKKKKTVETHTLNITRWTNYIKMLKLFSAYNSNVLVYYT